jgi:perosamine synthetase
MSSLKPIFISLSPNTERDDVLLAWKLKFQPWLWKKGKAVEELEEKFKKYLGVNYAISFNGGRASLMAILEAMEIKSGDEVLLQGFTCNAAVNPILNKGAKPVFVDIDSTLNLNPEDLKKKITPKSKAVMIQHTFGWPAQIEEILKVAKENNLYLIEDCAHALGAKYQGKFCGTFGDAAFFSFGRDKIISSVFGGMIVTDNEKMGERIKKFRNKLDYPSNFWVSQQLLHPVLTNCLILPAYGLNQYLGRILLGLFHKLSILSKAVYKKEKKGEIPECFPKRLPNALAALALNQFGKLERFNKHRRQIAGFYEKELKNTGFNLPLARSQEKRAPTFMRYPILVNKNTDEILKLARKKKIFLDDGWRKSPVIPPDTNINKMGYSFGNCPQAEKVAESILNLPTHINISPKKAQRIIDFLKTTWRPEP